MVYPPLDLATVGFCASLALIALYAWALWQTDRLKAFLRIFPRSRRAGLLLLTIVTVWTWLLLRTMDLGEFSKLRPLLLVVVPVAGVLSARFIDDFLSIRALGMLFLLLAEPLLEAAFLKPQTSRLLLVVLAYAMIVKGMFLVGTPYIFLAVRDRLLRSGTFLRAALMGGLAYGVALLVVTWTRFR